MPLPLLFSPPVRRPVGRSAPRLAITVVAALTRAESADLHRPGRPQRVLRLPRLAPSAGPDPSRGRRSPADGRDYVKASEVAAFYRFELRVEEDRPLSFRSPDARDELGGRSPLLTINDTRFLLTTPCLKRADESLIARVDLVKWIDPLLRPVVPPAAEWFDTVVIDPGHGGIDNGTRGAFGDEKTYTLDLADA